MTKPINLLLAASTFPRWEGDSQSDFVYRQVLWLKKIEPDTFIRILVPHSPGAKLRESDSGVDVIRYRYAWPASLQSLAYPAILPNLRKNFLLWFLVPGLFLSLFLSLLRECRRRRPDVIYAHWALPQGLIVALVARIFRLRAILTCHSSDLPLLVRVPVIGKNLSRFVLNSFDEVTAVNSSIVALARKIRTRKDGGVHLLPMGFDPELLEVNKDSGPEQAELLFLGRLSRKKGLKEFLKVLVDCCDILFRLVIAGEGEDRQQLEDLLTHYGLDERVQLIGYIRGEEKLELFRRCHFLILPSIVSEDGDVEGLPVALLEAMASKCVCIASAQANAQEVIRDGENGFIFDWKKKGNPQSILRKALALSATQRDVIGDSARSAVREFSWDRLVLRYRDLIEGTA